MKRKFDDPYVVVAGDFNQWQVDSALQDYVDMVEVPVGATRGSASIDRVFSNLTEHLASQRTVPPLEPDLPDKGSPSDHKIAYAKFLIPKIRKLNGCLLYTSPSPRD